MSRPVTWRLIEPFAGTAAVSGFLLGAKRQLVPYQGSKWKYRRDIAALSVSLGFWGAPSRVLLSDAGPWGHTHQVLWCRAEEISETLRSFAQMDAGRLYGEIIASLVPDDPVGRAARHLWLQRMSFSGKAVGYRHGRWSVHGLNTTSAYGRRATDRFGEVKPLGGALARAVAAWPQSAHVEALAVDFLQALDRAGGGDLVYLDPPYTGTTGYRAKHDRGAMVSACLSAVDRGAVVIISEAAPVDLPGATHLQMTTRRRRMRASSRQDSSEWLTVLGSKL